MMITYKHHDMILLFKIIASRYKLQSYIVFSYIVGNLGNFTYAMDLYKTSKYEDPVNNYPLEVNLNQLLHVQAEVIAGDWQLTLFIQECTATPLEIANDKTFYRFIENG